MEDIIDIEKIDEFFLETEGNNVFDLSFDTKKEDMLKTPAKKFQQSNVELSSVKKKLEKFKFDTEYSTPKVDNSRRESLAFFRELDTMDDKESLFLMNDLDFNQPLEIKQTKSKQQKRNELSEKKKITNQKASKEYNPQIHDYKLNHLKDRLNKIKGNMNDENKKNFSSSKTPLSTRNSNLQSNGTDKIKKPELSELIRGSKRPTKINSSLQKKEQEENSQKETEEMDLFEMQLEKALQLNTPKLGGYNFDGKSNNLHKTQSRIHTGYSPIKKQEIPEEFESFVCTKKQLNTNN